MNTEVTHALLRALPLAAAMGLALAFGAAGLVQLAGPGFVRRAYLRWELPPQRHRVIGALMLLAGLLLMTPDTRVWGAILAGLINFVSVVMLLNNREYVLALPGLAVLVALPPAILSAAV